MDDYYKILGVSKDASQDDIKRAYRELALKYHPDVNKTKDAEEKFKEINEAYAVLSDPEKRRQYDAYGPEGFSERYTQEDIFRDFNIDDIFKDLMGGMNFWEDIGNPFGSSRKYARASRDVGSDIADRLTISLQEAYTGTEKRLKLRHIAKCEHCNGTGAEPGSKIVKCKTCKGTGQVVSVKRTMFGMMQTVSICPTCNGTGKVYEHPCAYCNGTGRRAVEETVSIKIPPGIDDGMQLILHGMGDYGQGGSGDLYIEVRVRQDSNFKREGSNLFAKVHIPFYVAIIGGTVKIPTITGEREININGGIQNGETITLKGSGMPIFKGSGFGDEIVTFEIDMPKNVSAEQRDLIKKFAELDNKKRFGFF
ncbi:MAG: molecular chaperone DnaJ [Candidatus Micrarchaeaceae archaeon]